MTVVDRVADATLRCLSRWGLTKTTVDDIAREAGCSRATVYRAFPGGKDQLIAATVHRELARFFTAATERLDAAPTLEDLLTAGTVEAASFVNGHETIRYLVTHEPQTVMPHLAGERGGLFYRAAGAFAAPHLARFLDVDRAAVAGEWVARVVLSYTFWPADDVDLTDETAARGFVRTFLAPALQPEGIPA